MIYEAPLFFIKERGAAVAGGEFKEFQVISIGSEYKYTKLLSGNFPRSNIKESDV